MVDGVVSIGHFAIFIYTTHSKMKITQSEINDKEITLPLIPFYFSLKYV